MWIEVGSERLERVQILALASVSARWMFGLPKQSITISNKPHIRAKLFSNVMRRNFFSAKSLEFSSVEGYRVFNCLL